MITTRVRLSHFEKVLITETGARQSSNWATVLAGFLWGDKIIKKYFKNKILFRFY